MDKWIAIKGDWRWPRLYEDCWLTIESTINDSSRVVFGTYIDHHLWNTNEGIVNLRFDRVIAWKPAKDVPEAHVD